jgi:ribonuclease HI
MIKKHINVYVDGCYSRKYNNYAWSYILVDDKQSMIKHGSGVGKNKLAAEQYQIVGEILGVMNGCSEAYKLGYGSITIYYDLVNLEKWATGEWKRNTIFSKKYYDFIKFYEKFVTIKWVKVKAHSGVFYNELADKIANKAFYKK